MTAVGTDETLLLHCTVSDMMCPQPHYSILRCVHTDRFQDQKHGPGVFQCSNGSTYRGHFQHDEHHGHGEVLYVNGNSYSGNFVNGARSGKGLYRWANGDQYDGLWESNDLCNLESAGVPLYLSSFIHHLHRRPDTRYG